MKRMYYKFLVWLMGFAGGISSWAWREHVKILKRKQNIERKKLTREQENREYLEELKRKL